MAYIGSSPTKVVSRQSANIFTYTATANQTAFTGADTDGNTLACTPSDIMVHMNGLRLEQSDYTATTTTVTLGSGAAAGDEVTITAFVTFESADHYNKSTADTRYANVSGDTFTGNVTFAEGADIITASAGTDNVRIGEGAGDSIVSGGNSNVTIGKDAGTALTVGGHNVAMGFETLVTDTQGSHTTAIGRKALQVQNFTSATDSHNTAVGNNAGQAVTTGLSNTIVGSNAAYALTTSNSNTAIGKSALAAETSSNGNTAVGEGALQVQNVGGSGDARNTAVGLLAGDDISTGYKNTCIGAFAGNNLTTGNENVFLGYDVVTNTASDGKQIAIGMAMNSVGAGYITMGNTVDGRIYNQFSSNASWTRTSDERIKKDIQTNTDLGLDFINDLRTVTYKWKPPSEHPEEFGSYKPDITEAAHTEKMYGFIAQEVKAAMDTHNITGFNGWHVTPENQGSQQGVSYEMFVMPLVKAVQELSAKVNALETKVAALGGG